MVMTGNGRVLRASGGANQFGAVTSANGQTLYTQAGEATQKMAAYGSPYAPGAATLASAQSSPMQSNLTNDVPLVSLGCNCGSKGAFKELGHGAETLPFDWMCTTLEGVLKFISTDFQGFFDFQTVSQHTVSGVNFTLYRSDCHSFWHDDLKDPAEVEKYRRRIQRFCGISANNGPVLFVRLAASTDEIEQVGRLSQQLTQRFGPRAMLLLILDLQGSNPPGACTVAGLDNLMLYFLPTSTGGYEKYGPAINAALAWAAGRPNALRQLPTLASASALAMPTNWGYYGMGGIPAFEESRPAQVHHLPAQSLEASSGVAAALVAKPNVSMHPASALPAGVSHPPQLHHAPLPAPSTRVGVASALAALGPLGNNGVAPARGDTGPPQIHWVPPQTPEHYPTLLGRHAAAPEGRDSGEKPSGTAEMDALQALAQPEPAHNDAHESEHEAPAHPSKARGKGRRSREVADVLERIGDTMEGVLGWFGRKARK